MPGNKSGNTGKSWNMRRRGSTLKEYFKASKEDHTHSHSHVQIIGGGEFRKKGSQVKSWKIRSYYIKEDGVLMYFDPMTKEPKGVIDITEVALTEGPIENLHASGCLDFALENGISLMLTIFNESRKMEIVFDSLKEAKRFCLLLSYVATASNLLVRSIQSQTLLSSHLPLTRKDFVTHMKWDDLAVAIQSNFHPLAFILYPELSLPASCMSLSSHRRPKRSFSESTTEVESRILFQSSRGIIEAQVRKRHQRSVWSLPFTVLCPHLLSPPDDRGENTRHSLSTDEVMKLTEGFPSITPVRSDSALYKEEGGADEEGVGEVDVYIKNKPTIAELAAAERARQKETGFVIESSESEGEVETQRQRDPSKLTKNATIIHSGYFYKQGQVRKNWKQRYFELWFPPFRLSPLLLSTLLKVHWCLVVQRGQRFCW